MKKKSAFYPKSIILRILPLVVVSFALLFFVYYLTNSSKPDTSYGATLSQGPAKFEPSSGKMYYGIGQNVEDATIHTTQVKPGICGVYNVSGRLPRLLSAYTGLRTGLQPVIDRMKSINQTEGNYFVPVIALVVAGDVSTPTKAAESYKYIDDLFTTTTYDAQIRSIGSQAKSYNGPMFIRLFYEINSPGYHGTFFDKWAQSRGYSDATKRTKIVEGYRKIVNLMRQGSGDSLPNVAFVWHVMPIQNGTDAYYQSYFPGERYADWVGTSLFTVGQNGMSDFPAVKNFAASKNLPVMIPESSITKIDTLFSDGAIKDPDAQTYFTQYFNLINTPSNRVKGLVYINLDYSIFPYTDFNWWGDARLQSNSTILNSFANQIKSSQYDVPLESLKVSQKPFEVKGVTGRYEKDGISYIISGNKLWKLRRSDNQWIWGGFMKDDPFWSSAPTVNNLKPWDGSGVTAIWYVPATSVEAPYLRVISQNRFYRFNYTTNKWDYASILPISDPTNPWSDAKMPALNGVKPWQGDGVTAAWVAKDGYLRIVSKDKMWRLNNSTNTWDALSFSSLPADNPWKKAPRIDGLMPWEGAGITAVEFVNDGTAKGKLVIVSKDRFWTQNLNTDVWDTNVGGYGNYRELPQDNIWKKAPYIEVEGYDLPSNNQSMSCSQPTPVVTVVPTVNLTPTPTRAPLFTPTSVEIIVTKTPQ